MIIPHKVKYGLSCETGVYALSFSLTVKNELCRIEMADKCCLASELEGVINTNGILKKEQRGLYIQLTTENSAFARRVFSIIKVLYKVNPQVAIRKSKRLKKHVLYSVSMPVNDSLKNNIMQYENSSLNTAHSLPADGNKANSCCKRAYLRGAFLAGGSISDPEKTYHLEISCRTRATAVELKKLINSFGLNSKIIKRKSGFITYLKEGENIADFLNIIYAHNALLEFENIRILKEMRNNVNRIVNCETANLEKTVNASVRQVEKIKYIKEHIGLENLPDSLREIAELRLKYSDANLVELGKMLNPPLGKSGVNHRLRKLERIAEDIKTLEGR